MFFVIGGCWIMMMGNHRMSCTFTMQQIGRWVVTHFKADSNLHGHCLAISRKQCLCGFSLCPLVCFTWWPPLAGRGALHHQFPWRLTSRPRTSTRFPWGMTGSRFPSGAALRELHLVPLRRFLRPTPPQHSLSGARRRVSCG